MRAGPTWAHGIVVAVWLGLISAPASAQVASSPALFLETVRDPGSTDVRFGSGRACSVTFACASLDGFPGAVGAPLESCDSSVSAADLVA